MSENSYKLSIVIPTYNALGHIEGLCNSLSDLALKSDGNWQVVISDDASTDGTVPELKLSYPEFKFREDNQNRGFGANVNLGVENAEGDYIAIVNSDIELPGDPIYGAY